MTISVVKCSMLFWNQIFVQNMCGNQNNLSNTSAMYVRRKLQGFFYDGRHCSSQIVYPNVLITWSCRPAAREFEPINKKMITLNILEVVVVKNFIHLYSEFISSTKNSNNLNLLTCIYILIPKMAITLIRLHVYILIQCMIRHFS